MVEASAGESQRVEDNHKMMEEQIESIKSEYAVSLKERDEKIGTMLQTINSIRDEHEQSTAALFKAG